MARPSYDGLELFEALLAYVNDEVEEDDQISIEYTRESEKQLVIRIKRGDLEVLTAKCNYQDKLTQIQGRETQNLLEDFLGILIDNPTVIQDAGDWKFSLKLCHKDKEANLKEFDLQGEKKRKPQYPEEPQKTAPVPKIKIPYNNLGHRGILDDKQFVGREEDREKLHELFVNNSEVVVIGMPGVGKTELVLQYARKHLLDYQGGICWLQAKDWTVKLIDFAKVYNPNFDLPNSLRTEGKLAACWRQWKEGEVLLVLDDVTDYKQQVKPYLPESTRFKILITSRQRFGKTVLVLDVLSPEAALNLLKVLVGTERIESELEQAEELCQWLGYLPLGLELVGLYLVQEEYLELSLGDLLSQLRGKKPHSNRQVGIKHRALKNAEETMTADLGIEAAFDLSWERLDKKTQDLGCLLSLFALAPIPWSLVESMDSDFSVSLPAVRRSVEERDDWQEERDNLSRSHLLKFVEKDTYRLHQLIREFFRVKQNNLASGKQQKQNFAQVMAAQSRTIKSDLTQDLVQEIAPLIPHLAETAKTLLEWVKDEDLIGIFTGLGKFSESQGLYQEAEPWLQQCIEVAKSRFGSEHSAIANSLNNLASLYDNQGRYTEAEPLYRESLAMCKRLLGEEHPSVATSLNNLASLYRDQGRYAEAEPLYRDALAICKRLLGNNHPDIAQSLNNLAELYRFQGRYAEAEPLYRDALAMRKRLLGDNHPYVATTLNGLAALYDNHRRYSEAEPLYKEALAMYKRLLGDNHPYVATTLNNLAELYRSQGRYLEAEPLYKEVLAMYKHIGGEDHPSVATSLNGLSVLYYAQGRYEEAELLKKNNTTKVVS